MHQKVLLQFVNNVYGMYAENGNVYTHCPIHESQLTRYRHNYHGHIHSEIIPHEKYINVCCEKLDYTPLQLFKN
jgi:calcineurin-like phosphoesterase family protein